MKNYPMVLALVLAALLVALLWRIERHLAPLADFARAQVADRIEARQAAQDRRTAEEQAGVEASRKAQLAAQAQQLAATAAQQREREELARRARLEQPVKIGEKVPEIYLDNHSTVRDAVVVSVQASSVSFKVGAQLYNIPTDKLPGELQARVRNMFPPAPEPAPVAVPDETPAQ